eukprot:TRINITY_DN6364_c1_g1_i1.p1 TRINITY_DN6364_c1_g1~~TRINITY_DN6364_c1_g1_i1.p1  ORF type:complete len:630 (-),score=81.48 TRINITY_DN6364_c1_g1_i1:49-1938(-)
MASLAYYVPMGSQCHPAPARRSAQMTFQELIAALCQERSEWEAQFGLSKAGTFSNGSILSAFQAVRPAKRGQAVDADDGDAVNSNSNTEDVAARQPAFGMPNVRDALFEALRLPDTGFLMETPQPPDSIEVMSHTRSEVDHGGPSEDHSEEPVAEHKASTDSGVHFSEPKRIRDSISLTLREAVLEGKTDDIFFPELDSGSFAKNFAGAMQMRINSLLRWPGFDAGIAFIIFLDFVLLGLDAHTRLHPASTSPPLKTASFVIDLMCKLVYCFELALRFYGFGFWWCVHSTFIRMDIFLVLCSILALVMEAAAMGGVDFLAQMSVIRVLRVVRVARLARLTVYLRTLWLLISGLVHSMVTILWTFILILAMTYLFAVLAMELIVPPDLSTRTEYDRVATKSFGSLPDAMVTLLQVLTLDSIAAIYRPLMTKNDLRHCLVNCVFFTVYILVVSVALMNLVTAVMVEGSRAQAAQDQEYLAKLEEKRKATLLPEIKSIFQSLDGDMSDEVTLQELLRAPEHLKQRLEQITGTENPAEIFHLLDVDDSGTIQLDEFMEGLLKSSRGAGLLEFQLNKVLRQTDLLKQTLVDGQGAEEAARIAQSRSSMRWSTGDTSSSQWMKARATTHSARRMH